MPGLCPTITTLSASLALKAINRLNPGTRCWLTLPGMESLEAEVIWWNNGLVGCAFHQLLNPIIHDNIVAKWRGDGIFRSIP